MRLLFDASFPDLIQQYRELDLELWRWSAEPVTDDQLVYLARVDGFSGIVFLGVNALLDGRVVRAANQHRIPVAATLDTDPMNALQAVTQQLHAIVRALGEQRATLILAREIRPWLDADDART